MRRVFLGVLAGIIVLLLVVVLGVINWPFSDDNKEPASEEWPAAVTSDSFLKEAEQVYSQGDLIAAKNMYIKAMNDIVDFNKLDLVKKKIEDINMQIIFSSLLDEGSAQYVIQPNDALEKIAKNFSTTVELIRRANSLKSDFIAAGKPLKVNTSQFSVVIDKSQNVLFLKRAGEVIKSYVVATGKDNSTPAGNFKVINRLVSPTWFKTGAVISPDSPENILGSRWIGLDVKGYGIHGTIAPDQLGKQVTLGCVRMKNEDVEELFDVIPLGAEVTIVD